MRDSALAGNRARGVTPQREFVSGAGAGQLCRFRRLDRLRAAPRSDSFPVPKNIPERKVAMSSSPLPREAIVYGRFAFALMVALLSYGALTLLGVIR
jgi:hypothetical protein